MTKKEEKENWTRTETNVNPGSPSSYSGTVNEWDCGCVAATGGYLHLCPVHKKTGQLPPIKRRKGRMV